MSQDSSDSVPENNSDSNNRNDCVKYSSYAHPAIKKLTEMVEKLEHDWLSRWENPGNSEFQRIEDLIGLLSRTRNNQKETDKHHLEVFRYLCASVIYAQAIICSFQNSKTQTRITECPLFIPDHLVNEVKMPYLNEIAAEIVDELYERTFLKDQRTDLHVITRKLKLRQEYSGRIAGMKSPGNIPYLRVYSDQDSEVFLRSGFEISMDSESSKTNLVESLHEKINTFPVRIYLNGVYQPGYRMMKRLNDVIQDEELMKHILLGKYITRIQIHLPNFNQPKMIFEIDVTEEHITQDSGKTTVDVDLMEDYAGISREDLSKTDMIQFDQEDILISYFASKLYGKAKIQYNAEQLDRWSKQRIESYFSMDSKNKMYIGFCFKTILDGRYGDEYNVSASANLLLLALTRGYSQLAINNLKGRGYQPSKRPIIRLSRESTRSSITRIISWGRDSESESNMNFQGFGVTNIKPKTQDHNLSFLGATSRGITVKTNFPPTVIIVTIISVVWLLWYIITIFTGRQFKTSYDVAQTLGTFLEVISGEIAVALLLIKCLFLRKWEISDMLRSRRRARSLQELRVAIGGRMESAIELLASIPNPKEVFSRHKSCAFVDGGQGEFEIDEKITTEDLRKAGYKFGVNYYGEPIVADTRAQIRKVKFPDVVEENDTEEATIHIEGMHESQPKYVFEIPTETMAVAGTYGTPFSKSIVFSV